MYIKKSNKKIRWQWFATSPLQIAIVVAILVGTFVDSRALRGGKVVKGFSGVVEFQYFVPGSGSSCTGSMIAPDVVLTAAHCFDRLGATAVNGGSHVFTIYYHDPDEGRRRVFHGLADWDVFPTYNGTGPKGPGGSNDDVGVIQIPNRFQNTDYHDYLRIYSDHGEHLYPTVRIFGAGIHTYSNKSDDKLRMNWFDVENVEYNHIVIDTRKLVSTCGGDSGGPFIHYVGVTEPNKTQLPTIAAIVSKGELHGSEPDICTNNDPPYDDSFGSRTNWRRMQWVEDVTGINCDLQTNANDDYRRCFELPFIEDVEIEGTYEKDTAAAIAISVLF